MRKLQKWATNELSSPFSSVRTMVKYMMYYHTEKINIGAIQDVIKQYITSKHLYKRYEKQINGAKQWLKLGWPSYEEQYKYTNHQNIKAI